MQTEDDYTNEVAKTFSFKVEAISLFVLFLFEEETNRFAVINLLF